MSFTIGYTETAIEHLEQMTARERAVVLDTVRQRLADQPESPTRHRKRLRPNPLAPWCLRIGDLRVFYEVDREEQRVKILAVGEKQGNRLFIGGVEYRP